MKILGIKPNEINNKNDSFLNISQCDSKNNIFASSKRFWLMGQQTIEKLMQKDKNKYLQGNDKEFDDQYQSNIKAGKFSDLSDICREVSSSDSNQDLDTGSSEFRINSINTFLYFNNFDTTSIETMSPKPSFSYNILPKMSDDCSTQIIGIIDEMVKSEEVYINSLKALLNFYIGPNLNKKSDLWKPLDLLAYYVRQILNNHIEILSNLQKFCLKTRNIDELITKIFKLISERALDIYLYSNYCSIYDDIILYLDYSVEIIDENIRVSTLWYKGWEIFLEATQPSLKNRDLSFISLLQSPISRLGKYKVLLLKLCEYIDQNNKNKLSEYLEMAKNKLWKINNVAGNLNTNIHYKINQLLDFETVKYEIKISSQFFGKPLLIGSLFGVWVESNMCQSKTLGCFLYKTHLILCNFKTGDSPTEIRFIIPLCNSIISKPTESETGGLFSKYPDSMKLIFECNNGHYEILIMAMNSKEFTIWYDTLNLLINIVNGPSKLNFTNNTTHLVHFPKKIQPFVVKQGCKYKNYSGTKIEAKIKNEFDPVEHEPNNYTSENQIPTLIWVRMKKNDRIIVETRLNEIWSESLPLLALSKPNAILKKSKSWSSVKIPSLKHIKNIKKSYSNHSLLNTSENTEQNSQITPCGSNINNKDNLQYSESEICIERSNSLSIRLKLVVRDFFIKN